MNCPHCSSRHTERLFKLSDRLFQTTSESFQVCRCLRCHIRFLSPLPSADALSGYYPKSYWTDSLNQPGGLRSRLIRWYRKLVLRNHVRFVKQAVLVQYRKKRWVRLLDVGCGDGSFLQACKIMPCVGLDTSSQAVRLAKQGGTDAVQGTLSENPFQAGTFSVITMFHFLEHIALPEDTLYQIRQLLIPGGSLIVQVPNADSWQARLLKKRWGGYDVPRHLITYTTETLCQTLLQNRFEIVATSHFSLRDNAAMGAMSLVPGLYPPAREACEIKHSGIIQAWISDLAFLGITLVWLPFSLAESFMGHGASVMVHAKPVN